MFKNDQNQSTISSLSNFLQHSLNNTNGNNNANTATINDENDNSHLEHHLQPPFSQGPIMQKEQSSSSSSSAATAASTAFPITSSQSSIQYKSSNHSLLIAPMSNYSNANGTLTMSASNDHQAPSHQYHQSSALHFNGPNTFVANPDPSSLNHLAFLTPASGCIIQTSSSPLTVGHPLHAHHSQTLQHHQPAQHLHPYNSSLTGTLLSTHENPPQHHYFIDAAAAAVNSADATAILYTSSIQSQILSLNDGKVSVAHYRALNNSKRILNRMNLPSH